MNFARRGLLGIILCASLLLVFSCNEPPAPEPETWQEATPLHEIYAGDFLLGNIIRNTSDFSNASRSGILKRHYNVVTAENHMKPDQILPTSKPSSENWCNLTTANNIVNSSIAAGLKVHGHTLIWHSQSPVWLAAGGEDYMNKFITEVMTSFKGRVISWDVVNEAFRDNLTEGDGNDWKSCLRGAVTGSDAPWYTSMGADYIEKAFLAARAADPDVKLYYNDYGLNGVGKRMATYNMVKEINDRYKLNNNTTENLIDGIGMQSHHNLNTSLESVRASIDKFASLGVEIAISEMDILAAGTWNSTVLGSWGDDKAQQQAVKYAGMFKIFLEYSDSISRVTFWGLDDGTSWRGAINSVNGYPTLMSADYSLKPAFLAVMDPNRY